MGEKCYSNAKVFTGVVKIRKGLSCKLILNTDNLMHVHVTFHDFAKRIASKVKKTDKNADRTLAICRRICNLTDVEWQRQKVRNNRRIAMLMAITAWFMIQYDIFQWFTLIFVPVLILFIKC